jgi:F-type H+-transporting ATPase subunit alpha
MVTELMKQPQYQPLQVWEMALTLFAANNGYFDDIEVPKALAAEKALREFAKSNHGSLVEEIERDKKFSKEVEAKLHELLKDFKKNGAY